MNKPGRFLLIIALSLIIYVVIDKVFLSGQLQKIEMDIPDDVDLEISRGYLLPEQNNHELTYVLSQSPRKLWIASTTLLPKGSNKTATYPYSLQVSVFDKNDTILLSNEFYHQTSEATLVTLKSGSQLYPEAFIGQSSQFKLGETESIHVTLPEGATRLVVRKNHQGPEISDIAIRAYQYVQRSSRVDPLSIWERLSAKQKRRLTEKFPFEDTFLSDQERANLAEFRWQPLVPHGDEGEDYQAQIMYRIPGSYISEKKLLLSRYDHMVDAYKRVSFPIEVAGQYRLEGNHSFKEGEFDVEMTWHNQNDSYQKSQRLTFNSSQFSEEIALRPGLVSFTSSIPLSIDLFAVTGAVEEHDHFSSPVLLTAENSLEYTLHHMGNDNMPLQIQFRAFAEQQRFSSRDARLLVTTVDQAGDTQSIEVAPDFVPEENSQIVNEEFYNWLGIAKKHFLMVDNTIEKLRLTSNSPLLVSLYTRLAEKPAMRVLPMERRDWYDYAMGVPDWFAIRPDNWSQLLNTGDVKLLKHYHRSLLAEQVLPDPDESYQSLLNDFEQLVLSDLIVKNPYPGQPVKLEENTALNFARLDEYQGAETSTVLSKPVSQKLFYLQKEPQTREISWRRNNIPQKPIWVVGKWGIIDERATAANFTGQLQLDAEDIDWFISGVPREQAQWQQRRASLLSTGHKIELSGVKNANEKVVTLIAYTTSQKPVELSVNFKNTARNQNVADTFTILNRLYRIQPQDFYAGYQLAGNRRIVGRQSFSVSLGHDIPNGEFRIDISQLAGDDVFLSVVTREIKPAPIVERYRTGIEH